MPIKLNGSTSGYVQIDAPAVAGATQITLPAVTGGSFVVSDASGNVGIGTASPAYNLHVRNAGGNSYVATQYGTGTIGYMVAASNEVQFKAFNGTNDVMTFATGASERVRIDSSGNLQVGGTTVANTTGYVNSRTNARAWVRWVGSTGAITAAYNVSSVTRNATGNYTITYTTPLADANNAPIGMTAGATVYNSYGVYMNQNAAPTTTNCGIGTMSNAGVVVDCISNQLVVFGN
jgi:hypothetical protein